MTKSNAHNLLPESDKKRKVLSGVVVSNKMKDTVVVSVSRYVKHPKFKKYYKVAKRFKAHDAGNTCAIGDRVSIVSTRPISKDKHFSVMKEA